MQTNFPLTHEQKRNIQNQVFDDILKATDCLKSIRSAYKTINLNLPMPSYANLRDALFHYVKICEYTDFATVNGNMYALNEHLQRGIKDALIRLLSHYADWLEFFCVKHEVLPQVVEVIKKNFPDFARIDLWDADLFMDTHKKLKSIFSTNNGSDQNLSVGQLNSQCLSYCAKIVQEDDPECIAKLRGYMHFFRNQILKIRSASSAIENPYKDYQEIDDVVLKVEKFYKFMLANRLHCTSLFLFSHKAN